MLDELHTHRVRQGANEALLVRRVRKRLSPERLQCIGTSATMVSEGSREDTNAERLDVFNGLLLAPHFDAAFDGGFIPFADDGAIMTSLELEDGDRRLLGRDVSQGVRALHDGHRGYLPWHRERVFRSASALG